MSATEPGPAAQAAVIAHYHAEGHLPRHLLALVRVLAARVGRIVFVSTGLSDAAAAELEPFAAVIRRENIGYDFWSYKTGIDALGDRSGLERLLLLNSSFICIDPDRVCAAMLGPIAGPALRGLSLSHDRDLHLQSYCLAFEDRTLIASQHFAEWWQAMTPVSDREQVIIRYELGLSRHFADAGVPLQAAYEPDRNDLLVALCRAIGNANFSSRTYLSATHDSDRVQLDLQPARSLNPTHYLWDRLYARFGILKIELLRDNPTRQNLARFRQQLSPAVQSLITDGLR
ncbi:rhamnan synthesis F family protein [Arenimonas sp. GDDSR-1]|uniref:rhamnan synthesis F family protein n=1 Tax=Arenimonas sp. GDDSR-1 TaxID=2950125 RepID=UPI00262F8980|nr:rhamnan synthesis F family protein [Arenimonas sp. GDDSR-1]